MDYCIIRHKVSGELMPLFRKGRGYTHWNPSNQKKLVVKDMGVPRLIKNREMARRVIRQWIAMPNAEYSEYTNSHGEDDYDIRFTDDGRKKEDLEILPVTLIIGEVID